MATTRYRSTEPERYGRRLEDPHGLSPITTGGRYDSLEAGTVPTDEVCAAG